MKERPILFSAPMIRALLSGAKTQTRRVIKDTGLYAIDDAIHGREVADRERLCLASQCPYGVPGDRLWVREGGCRYRRYGQQPGEYQIDFEDKEKSWRVLPARFFPRWASRITLEITDVCVQRLQDIDGDEAEAEGVYAGWGPYDFDEMSAKFRADLAIEKFEELWDSINDLKPGCSWADNPWVWAITFRRIRP